MTRIALIHLSVRSTLVGITATLVLSAAAMAEERRYISGFAGTMTEGRWHEALNPQEFDAAGSGLLGIAAGWERRIRRSRFSMGVEVQVVGHFGRQDHVEFNLPATLRYSPPHGWLRSAAFGLGLSYATKVPQVEIDRSGNSQRAFFYWMAETEFDLATPGNTIFLRMHHRSDGYGVFDADSGSTGLVIGWRRSF